MIWHKENIENDYAYLWIENKILFFKYKADIFIDLDAARIIVSDRISLQKERPYPVLCYTEGITSSDKTARDYLSLKGVILTKAISYLASPTVSLAMLHFYLEKNKPAVPSEIFTSELLARKFLEPFMD